MLVKCLATLLAAGVLSACGPRTRTSDSVPVAAPADTFVLLKSPARLFQRPDLRATNWPIQNSGGAPVFVARLIKTTPRFVEIETIGTSLKGGHCYDNGGEFRGLALRFHVPLDAVSPVVTKHFERSFADGSAITLEPGVAIARSSASATQGRNEPLLSGTRLDVTVPDRVVERSYRLGPAPPVNEPADRVRVLANGSSFEFAGSTHPAGAFGVTMVVVATEDRGMASATWRAPCARLTISTPTSGLVAPTETPIESGLPGKVSGVASETVGAGASVYWPDGTSAGRVVEAVSLQGSPRKGPRGLLCYSWPKPGGQVVCFAPEDLMARGFPG
ncbi:MAG: hypothetical protein IT370_09110 [Deltaproteobacteria bacterium]|nr:hypothetical protein [Deltaproteobacteria bacterium]